jgi:hypothetical protein
MLNVEIAVAKVPKYAELESGDSVEVIERPRGGISVVMADGQRSGRSAKAISNMAVRKAVSLLAEGVRDGAVARAAHDYLELTIVSLDLETESLVISRNSRCPVLVLEDPSRQEAWRVLDDPAEPVGVHVRARPVVVEFPLRAGQAVVAFTDGLLHAGSRRGGSLDPIRVLSNLGCPPTCPAKEVADGLLHSALILDEGRPADDVTVAVLQTFELDLPDTESLEIRRMTVSFPVSLVRWQAR